MKNSLTQRVRATGALLGVLAVMVIVTLLLNACGMTPIWLYATTYLVLGTGAVVLRRTTWFASRWGEVEEDTPVRAGHDLKPIGSYGILVPIALSVVLSIATALWMAHAHQTSEQTTSSHSTEEVLAILLLSPVIGPMVEELVFRGVVYPVLRRGFGITVSALVSAGLFALVHAEVMQGVYVFAMALVLALVYETSRRLRDVMIIHVVHNVAGILLVGVDPGRWVSVDLCRVLACLIWSATLLGLYEYVTAENDARAGFRTRGQRASREETTREETDL